MRLEKRTAIMKKVQCLTIVCLLVGSVGAYAQDVKKGTATFNDNCGLCHSTGTDQKMGPGLKGLFKKPKLTNGKPMNDANVLDKINTGGNGMPAFKDMLAAPDKANVIAYLKTL